MSKSYAFGNLINSQTGEPVVIRDDMPNRYGEDKMTNSNENELKVGDVALRGLNGLVYSFDQRYGGENQGSNTCMIAISLIKSQQSRIELLESAIRDAIIDLESDSLSDTAFNTAKTLRNLMENEK